MTVSTLKIELYELQIVAVTNYYRCCVLKQQNFITYCPGWPKFKMGLLGLKSRCCQGYVFFWRLEGRTTSLSSPISRGPHTPWLLAPPSSKPAMAGWHSCHILHSDTSASLFHTYRTLWHLHTLVTQYNLFKMIKLLIHLQLYSTLLWKITYSHDVNIWVFALLCLPHPPHLSTVLLMSL